MSKRFPYAVYYTFENDLANGKRVYDVFVAGDGAIVKAGTKAIKTQADLGFRPDEIVSVMSEIR